MVITVYRGTNGRNFEVHEEPPEEQIKKAEEEARLLAMTKPEVIKVVQEEDEKIGIDPKAIKGAKAGE
ncbi:hypothetical protein Tco_0486057, partial [Tanacetum coccineum]